MHLRKLQYKLAKNAVDMYEQGDEVDGWEVNLREYGKFILCAMNTI